MVKKKGGLFKWAIKGFNGKFNPVKCSMFMEATVCSFLAQRDLKVLDTKRVHILECNQVSY